MSKRNLWTNEETKLMLDIIKDNMFIKERGGMSRNNTKLFKTVEEEMVEAGYCMKDFHQIGVKWKNMKCAYFTSKKAVAENLERKELIPFYEEMEEILEMNYSTASDENEYKLYNSENNDGSEHTAPITNDTEIICTSRNIAQELFNQEVMFPQFSAIIHKTDWSNSREHSRKLLQKQGTTPDYIATPHNTFKQEREDYDHDECEQDPFENLTPVHPEVITREELTVHAERITPTKKRKSNSESDSASAVCSLVKYILEQNENKTAGSIQSDGVDVFLAGIAPTLRSLTPFYLNMAKTKIFAAVQEFEMAMLMEHRPGRSGRNNGVVQSTSHHHPNTPF